MATQDGDAWHAEHNQHARNTIRNFLLWCSASKLTRPFRLPPVHISRAAPMPQTERLELIRLWGPLAVTTRLDPSENW
ncbi:hypothetical protein JK364_45155 [Streptomyces sp. 110]|uniref:Integrase n=1 Tax=Streptomyces endocoffeicus TaxID=2898945 RepID=A0ABS1Q6C1_9ACTN|nr:hypothetical protein [Streptomyces endocoffeicus]MBL1119486.1 hypothetical protein [Streptomyces endocoffeicus]